MSAEKDLNYWKDNAEEDYMTTPISVLRYIKELEEANQPKEIDNFKEKLFKSYRDEDIEELAFKTYPYEEGMDRYGDTYDIYAPQRKAFIKGYTLNQNIREAAEKVVEVYKISSVLWTVDAPIKKLEKALK